MKFKTLKHLGLLFSIAITLSSCQNRVVREINDPITNKPLEKYEVVETSDGSFLKDGYCKKWFSNGQIGIDCNYKLNKKDGSYKTYFTNGQIEINTNYNEDSIDGDYLRYNQNGQKIWEGKYSKGKEVGEWKNWHDNGQLKGSKNYVDGKLEGEQKYWYSNGQVSLVTNYSKGEKIGTWKSFDEDGELNRIYKFEGGNDVSIVGKWKIDNSAIIEYLPDYTFLYTNNDSKSKGKYKIEDDKLLLTYDSGSGTSKFKIIKLIDDQYEIKETGLYFSSPTIYKAVRIQ